MKKTTVLALVSFAFYMVSCGPSQKITSSWINKDADLSKKYTNIFILAMTQNVAARNIVESDLANAAQAKGYKVFKSSEVFMNQFTSKETAPSKDSVLAKAASLGCDAIFTVGLVDKTSETRYVPGMVSYSPYMGYGYGFGGYYGYMSPAMYSPGYYTTDKTYFMEAHVFDVATEKLVWSAQSEAYDPSSISKFSREYTAIVVEKISADFKSARKK